MVGRLSAVGLVDWNPLAEALAESRPGTFIPLPSSPCPLPSSPPNLSLHSALAERRELMNEWVVLIFDNRGVGGSVQPKQLQSVDYTVQDLSDDVVDLVRRYVLPSRISIIQEP